MRNALTTQEGLKRSLEQTALDFYIFLAVDEPGWAWQPGQGTITTLPYEKEKYLYGLINR